MTGPRVTRRDGTHDARKSDFLSLGCTVADLHMAGLAGFPDIVVGCMGANHLVEIKDTSTAYGRKGLNANQSNFARHWNGGPVFVVACTDDCIDLVNTWRAHTSRVMR